MHQDRKKVYEGSSKPNSIGSGSESNRDSLYKMWEKIDEYKKSTFAIIVKVDFFDGVGSSNFDLAVC